MIYRPTLVCAAYDLDAPGADTGLILTVNGARHSPDHDAYLDVVIAVTTASVLNLTATDGTTTHKWWGVNGAAELSAERLASFRVPILARTQAGVQLQYDLELETDGVVELLVVRELHYVS